MTRVLLRVAAMLFALLAQGVCAADFEWLKEGVVGIASTSDGLRRSGTGVIVWLDAQAAYILTASHVVEGDANPIVTFVGARDTPHRGSVVQAQGGNTNGLALLRVGMPLPKGAIALAVDESDDAHIGEPAVVVGFPANVGVSWALTTGSVIGQKGTESVFAGTLNEGNSGGPMVVDGRVGGIVVSATRSEAYVVPATIVRLFLKGSGIDLSRLTPAGPGAGASAASVPRTWPALGQARWVTFTVHAVDYLPPMTDQWGEPDFVLRARTSLGVDLFGHEISVQRSARSAIHPATVLAGVDRITFQVLEEDGGLFGKTYETVTRPLDLALPALARNNRVRLTIDPSLFKAYPFVDATRTGISLSFQLDLFDPEGASGRDASPDTPTSVPGGQLAVGDVSFNERDATDHLLLDAGAGSVVAVLWSVSTRGSTVEALPDPGAARFTPLLRTELPDNSATETLQVVNGNGSALRLRAQAREPGATLQYQLFVLEGGYSLPAYQRCVSALLDSEVTAREKSPGSARTSLVGPGIAALRRHFKATIENHLPVLDTLLTPQTDARVEVAMALINSEFDAYARAAAMPRKGASPLPGLIAILKAERGLAPTPSEIEVALASSSESLVVKAIEIVRKSKQPELAHRLLPRLLLDQRTSVHEAARAVLTETGWRP